MAREKTERTTPRAERGGQGGQLVPTGGGSVLSKSSGGTLRLKKFAVYAE